MALNNNDYKNKENASCQAHSTLTLDMDNKVENYNPLIHRKVAHPTSTLGSFLNLLKSSLGSGVLAMPAAFKDTGIIPGCIGTILVGIIATHCIHILVQTSRDVCKETQEPSLSYSDTCEKVFKHGPKWTRPWSTFFKHFADFAMVAVCLGGTAVYVVFIASSLKDIFDHFYPEQEYDVKIYCAMLLIPLILIAQVRYLKFLVPFSVVANVCFMITFGITCFYTFTGVDNHMDTKLVTDVSQWPLFLSTAIFAMEGINVVMPVENEMSNPEHFLGCPGVLSTTMILVVLLYGAVGLFGYLKYGESVLGSITLNLPGDEPLALSAKFLIAVAVFFTYCLQMYAPMDIIWLRIKSRFKKKFYNIAQIALRTLSVVFTVVLAVAIPDLELLIGLVGAIFFSTLGLLIPVIIETVHKWERDLGLYFYVLWKNGLLVLFYLLVLFSGCYLSISKMVNKYS
ncbi:proton-coupled amino acid transporter-like protein pathetic [Hyposmocoma kahamanoa]|uniref:proton-coupled amino acid transporter-like protein pathetic n=1 Tax=Hyposmocoma kahamanoa TaxID=1477025 RepID=UPI000E6D7FF6|nr:proton-coupled amino acid transporter-like protein pathetic [Hyposmocoma kahamanoa]XP_026313981.1 proton-coupled amino acid transporter-like protein pathetic [Hyposmocoma kahamanoa]